MGQETMHSHKRRWTTVFVIGLVVILIILLMNVLSGQQSQDTGDGLTPVQEQALVDALAARQDPESVELSAEEEQALIDAMAERQDSDAVELTPEEEQALIDAISNR